MSSNGTPVIDVRNIVKHYGSVIALSGVSMTVHSGEVLCLLGDNGAGKSTLIKTLSGVMQPTSGDVLQLSYDNATQFLDCDPSVLSGMMIETEDETQSSGVVLATQVALIDHSASSSELYGLLGGPDPNSIGNNLLVEGGEGLNVSTNLIGKNVTVDRLAAGYSVNRSRMDLTTSQDLVFDEPRVFPGQFVAVQWNSLIVPDPDSTNAGYIQPRMIELQEQTLSGQVFNYVFDSGTQTGTFTLSVAGNSPIKILNSGLVSITVRQVPRTYLRNSPTFADGDTANVRGLLFVDPNYADGNYHPSDPVAFIMVADRISK